MYGLKSQSKNSKIIIRNIVRLLKQKNKENKHYQNNNKLNDGNYLKKFNKSKKVINIKENKINSIQNNTQTNIDIWMLNLSTYKRTKK